MLPDTYILFPKVDYIFNNVNLKSATKFFCFFFASNFA